MPLLRNIGVLATCPPRGGQSNIGLIRQAALAWENDTILWAGPERELPRQFSSLVSEDAAGRLVVPGLIDCHTHLAFGGWRSAEFGARILGKSYLEISREGGGIASTVSQTRSLSEEELTERCRGFLEEMVRLGITTVECKSGYGLDSENELKLLRVYRRLAQEQSVRIVPTLLAHLVPSAFQNDRNRYVKIWEEELIPAVASEKLAEFCDVFLEESAFLPREARRILEAAARYGLRAKVHADQFSQDGGAEFAAALSAVSAEHL